LGIIDVLQELDQRPKLLSYTTVAQSDALLLVKDENKLDMRMEIDFKFDI
jgi:hypothetical protein